GTYEVTASGSAPEALEVLAASPADVVLLDIVMPGVDGMQLLEELRSRFPNLPIIMLTATRTVKTAVQAMKLGAFHYITKPFDVEDLRAHLDKATEQAALVREVEERRSEVGAATTSRTSSDARRACRRSSRPCSPSHRSRRPCSSPARAAPGRS